MAAVTALDLLADKRAPPRGIETLADLVDPHGSRSDELEQPLRSVGKFISAVDRPGVSATARVHARRGDQIAAIAADIHARQDRGVLLVADVVAGRPAEIEMPAVTGNGFDGWGKEFAMLLFELEQQGLAVVVVDIETPNSVIRTGGDADVEIAGPPPPRNDVRVGRGPPQIVGDRRLLGVLDAGEDPHAQGAGELERRGAERGHGHAFPRGSVVEMSIQPKILPASAQA